MWRKVYEAQIIALLRCAQQGWQRGLTAGSGGNISCRVNEGMLITAGGSSFRTLTMDDILLLNPSGQVLAGGMQRYPSMESRLHLTIYQNFPAIQAIYHVHPVYSCYYACAQQSIPLLTAAGKTIIKEIPLVPEAAPGSDDLADNLLRTMLTSPNCMALELLGHGIITLGDSIDHAYDLAELVEAEAHTAWLLDKLYYTER